MVEDKVASNYILWPSSGPLVEMRGLGLGTDSTRHPVALDWTLTLCVLRKYCGSIRLAVGGQNQ